MSNNITENLERLLLSGKDGALLRFSLGSQYLKLKEPAAAIGHLQRAVAFDPDYSAAWKQLGRAFAEAGRPAEALEAYRQGIEAVGASGYTAMQLALILGENHVKLVPDVAVSGEGTGGGLANAMIAKLMAEGAMNGNGSAKA